MKSTRWVIMVLLALFLVPFFRSLAGEKPGGEKGESTEDKLVRLMSAQSVHLLEKDGKAYRKAEGPARFLHNDTWLICDTALWDVDSQIIHAVGNVRIEQERTELKSDSLTYFVNRNVAEFRGALVQLQDKDGNTLRTRNLDYNTKDSIAVFNDGAAMRDKDGQLIESIYGTYDSKARTFFFYEKVNMFTDSVFVKTSSLLYDANTSVATFDDPVDAWKDGDMFSGDSGWWDRRNELFFFKGNVHLMSETQEGWSDSLYVERAKQNVEMLGNAQLTDTVRAVTGLGGRIYYCDTLSRVEMERDPVVLMESVQKDKNGVEEKDTVYFRADSLSYWTLFRHLIEDEKVNSAKARMEELSSDPVANIRLKAAEEAAKKYQEAIDADPNADPTLKTEYKQKMEQKAAAAADSLDQASKALDKFIYVEQADSLVAPADSALATGAAELPKDSTKIGFLNAVGKVKVFRKSMQAVCDSLVYSDMDSLARLFNNPVIWNDVNHQYTADSIFIAVRNEKMDKAYLLSNAFIHIYEGETYYDQIRSAEMTAYFNDSTELSRFDALGGASAIFFFKEKDRISTANKKEATILMAEFEGGDVRRITYFESPKSAIYPIAQMNKEDMKLKGFNWVPQRRPSSPDSLTSRIPRRGERHKYDIRPRARFPQTEIYFKGYMAQVYRQIERSDSIRRARNSAPDEAADTTASAPDKELVLSSSLMMADLQSLLDSLVVSSVDSLKEDVLFDAPVPLIDSLLAVGAARKAYQDSLASIKTPEQLKKEAKLAEKERKKAERQARKDARQAALLKKWEEADQRDALRQARRDAVKRERKERKAKAKVEAVMKLKRQEDLMMEEYRNKYLELYRKNGVPLKFRIVPAASESVPPVSETATPPLEPVPEEKTP